jgi:ABC-type transport system involved in multi-copper enzyme maturation permease subunit
MTALMTIAALTIREAARRKLLVALAVLTLIVIGLTGWGFQHLTTLTNPDGTPVAADELRLATSQVLVLVEFMFSAVLALSAVVVASPSISSEVESGVALAILARPVSRYQVVVGKWLGFAALIVVYVGATTCLELLVVGFTTGYVPPGPVALGAYLVAEGIVVMSLALVLSTWLSGMTAGVVALVLFFVAWIGGIAGAIGEVFGNSGITNAGTISQLLLPTDALWRGSVYELEPVLYRDVLGATTERAGNPFFVQSPPSIAFLTWTFCWVVLIVGLAVWNFHRREV